MLNSDGTGNLDHFLPDVTPGTLIHSLSKIEAIAAEFGGAGVLSAARELRAHIGEGTLFVAVVGQFKRGKSTFLNAILGTEILPVGVLPVTSVVTLLRYGPILGVDVVLENSERFRIEIGELRSYVSEEENPGNRKQVRYVEVSVPSPLLQEGIVVADTPGIGSMLQHGTKTTYNFISRIDLAIFITAADAPMTESEYELFQETCGHAQNVFVIVNKKDLVNATELDQILKFVHVHTQNAKPNDTVPVFAVSAREHLSCEREGIPTSTAGLTEFESMFSEFLVRQGKSAFQSSIAQKAAALTKELRVILDFSEHSALSSLSDLEHQVATFQIALQGIAEQQEENRILLRTGLSKLCDRVQNEAVRDAAEFRDALKEAAFTELHSHRSLGRIALADHVTRFIQTRIAAMLDQWRKDAEAKYHDELKAMVQRFAKRVSTLVSDAREAALSHFGIALSIEIPQVEVVVPRVSGYVVAKFVDWGIGRLPLLLPGRLYQSFLERRLTSEIPLELERNATRVAVDLKESLSKALQNYQSEFDAFTANLLELLRKASMEALGRRKGAQFSGERILTQVQTAREELLTAQNNLATLSSQSTGASRTGGWRH